MVRIPAPSRVHIDAGVVAARQRGATDGRKLVESHRKASVGPCRPVSDGHAARGGALGDDQALRAGAVQERVVRHAPGLTVMTILAKEKPDVRRRTHLW